VKAYLPRTCRRANAIAEQAYRTLADLAAGDDETK
jgi:hypothetical protein